MSRPFRGVAHYCGRYTVFKIPVPGPSLPCLHLLEHHC